jgi:hypothetical protein
MGQQYQNYVYNEIKARLHFHYDCRRTLQERNNDGITNMADNVVANVAVTCVVRQY